MKNIDNQNKEFVFNKRMQRKLAGVFLGVILIFIVLIIRITYINTTNGNQYKKQVLEQQSTTSEIIPFRRGTITDRNGQILAVSKKVYNVILDAKVLNETTDKIKATKQMLYDIFGIEKTTTEEILTNHKNSRYNILLKNVDYNTAKQFIDIETDDKLSDLYAGVWLEPNYKREYPFKTYASALIGFTSDGNVGNWGIEQQYNDTLNGTNGRAYSYSDNESSLVEQSVEDAVDGKNIVSTIDINVQSFIESRVDAFNKAHQDEYRKGQGAEHISVIVMNPKNGEILGLESFPNYNLNSPSDLSMYYSDEQIAKMDDDEYVETLQSIWRNFAISDAYEPGSTAKPFTVATGFETGVLTGNETYECDGSLTLGDNTIHCHHTDGHGTQTLKDAIANSCNVSLMEVALQIGQEKFARYQNIFGFGTKTSIDLPGEGVGSIYDASDMSDTDLATNSFGQNFTCTQIQMASAYCSLINDGNYYKPHVVKAIQDSNGNTISEVKKELMRKTVSKTTSKTLREYMRAVVTDGTGKAAAVDGYDVAGKTGTAETLPRGNNEYVLSFCGFAPANDPEVLVYVVIDRPNTSNQETTSLVNGLAHDIMSDIFPYLGITRSGEE